MWIHVLRLQHSFENVKDVADVISARNVTTMRRRMAKLYNRMQCLLLFLGDPAG